LPSAVTTQDAVDNFVVAASSAAGQDLVPLFKDRWRWPVSKGVIKDLSKQWSGMTKALQPDPNQAATVLSHVMRITQFRPFRRATADG
jgi:hypothetical protein